MDLGVVIVTYNSAREVGTCLDACRRHGLFDSANVLVVDNASADDTVRQTAGVACLANTRNLGFAAAVNQGTGQLDNPYILLLNPDAVLETDVSALLAECRKPDVGAVGGRLVDATGRTQRGFQVRRFPTAASLCFEVLGINRLWPSNPVNRRYRCLDLDPNVPADVEQPAGAFLMFKKSAWREIRGFDEAYYPLWFEDVDFLKRVDAAGYRVRYVPDSIASHAGGHSLDSVAEGDRQLYWYGSLLIYVARHFSRPERVLLAVVVVVGVSLRSVMGTMRSGSFAPLQVCGKVIHLAWKCLLAKPPENSGRRDGFDDQCGNSPTGPAGERIRRRP